MKSDRDIQLAAAPLLFQLFYFTCSLEFRVRHDFATLLQKGPWVVVLFSALTRGLLLHFS